MIADVLRRADGTNKRAEDGVDVGGRRPIARLIPISPPLPTGRGALSGLLPITPAAQSVGSVLTVDTEKK